ncbi:MAG: hypothetical protein ACRD0G_16785 [Acidimicrobiales bacterium]
MNDAEEGMRHLQAAAKEMIAAARSFLDAAEDLVDDPSAVRSFTDMFGDVVKEAAKAGRRFAGQPDGGNDDGDDGGYERIRVS